MLSSKRVVTMPSCWLQRAEQRLKFLGELLQLQVRLGLLLALDCFDHVVAVLLDLQLPIAAILRIGLAHRALPRLRLPPPCIDCIAVHINLLLHDAILRILLLASPRPASR